MQCNIERRDKKVIQFVNYKGHVNPDNYFQEWSLLYVLWQSEDIDLLHWQTSYVHIKQSNKNAELWALAQIIDNVVDEVQDTNVDTDITVSADDGNKYELMEMPHEVKYDYSDADRPSIQSCTILGQLWTMKYLWSMAVFR